MDVLNSRRSFVVIKEKIPCDRHLGLVTSINKEPLPSGDPDASLFLTAVEYLFTGITYFFFRLRRNASPPTMFLTRDSPSLKYRVVIFPLDLIRLHQPCVLMQDMLLGMHKKEVPRSLSLIQRKITAVLR